jgi:hypothetical protein
MAHGAFRLEDNPSQGKYRTNFPDRQKSGADFSAGKLPNPYNPAVASQRQR